MAENAVNKWDRRMLEKARLIASWSKDPDHQLGAVIALNRRSIGEGFNGPPRGLKDFGLQRHIEVTRTIHAEINAIIFAAQPLTGATIYVYPYLPCATCAAIIIQAGISRVIYHSDQILPNWEYSQKEAINMFKEAGVDVFKIGEL